MSSISRLIPLVLAMVGTAACSSDRYGSTGQQLSHCQQTYGGAEECPCVADSGCALSPVGSGTARRRGADVAAARPAGSRIPGVIPSLVRWRDPRACGRLRRRSAARPDGPLAGRDRDPKTGQERGARQSSAPETCAIPLGKVIGQEHAERSGRDGSR